MTNEIRSPNVENSQLCGRRFRHSDLRMMGDSTPKAPVLAFGSRLTVTIRDIAFGGEGVARVDDFVIFVPFVVLGEEVEIEIIEAKKRFARARLLRVLRPASERVAPPCRYFGQCGGCQYQHIDYPAH